MAGAAPAPRWLPPCIPCRRSALISRWPRQRFARRSGSSRRACKARSDGNGWFEAPDSLLLLRVPVIFTRSVGHISVHCVTGYPPVYVYGPAAHFDVQEVEATVRVRRPEPNRFVLECAVAKQQYVATDGNRHVVLLVARRRIAFRQHPLAQVVAIEGLRQHLQGKGGS